MNIDVIITPDRVSKLKSLGIIIQPEQILSQLFGVVAQTDNWNRPTLTADFNGYWTAYLASSDAHFSDLYKVTANTPENAIADLLLALINAEAAKRVTQEVKQTMGFRSRRPTDKYR